jgi:hypothetical protein
MPISIALPCCELNLRDFHGTGLFSAHTRAREGGSTVAGPQQAARGKAVFRNSD